MNSSPRPVPPINPSPVPIRSGSWISGISRVFTWATMRDEGFGWELFLTFTFGFLSFIFGRSIGCGASNSGSGRFTTVNTTNRPAMKKMEA